MKIKIVLEIANNHSGSVSHLKDIVNSMSDGVNSSESVNLDLFEIFFKFQFRDLDTFISPHVDVSSNKHIKRFLDTKLVKAEWIEILEFVKSNGYGVQVTPFDEPSVLLCEELGIDDFKIASCSATDWSLIAAIAAKAKKVTFSTGGLNLRQVDNLYSYFCHRDIGSLSILHCCGIYPAPYGSINLSTLETYKVRYPEATIGYSGHEDPSCHTVALMAFASGAKVIERHVGLASKEKSIALNAYSLSAKQVVDWLEQISLAALISGSPKDNDYINAVEKNSIRSLQRGAIAARSFNAGDSITNADVQYAFPPSSDQLIVEDIASFYNSTYAVKSIIAGEPILKSSVTSSQKSNLKILHEYIHSVRGILNASGYEYLPITTEVEISHHYGISQLEKFGCCLVNVVNRNYCKKLIVLTKGQKHPEQKHEIKEEFFIMISGILDIVIDGEKINICAGDTVLVRPGCLHEFSAVTDCVFEEVSTTSIPDDSYYSDHEIRSLARSDRKTTLQLHFSS